MSVIISNKTVYMIQGLTGKEGLRAAEWMIKAGAVIAAGVTPGKGGQEVLGIPVYETVIEALVQHPEISATSVYVPPAFVKSAALEAISAKISLVHIIAENVPTLDTVEILEKASAQDVRVVGPSSVGILTPQSVVGSLGGGSLDTFLFPENKDAQGIAIISKSGGMANTMADVCTQAGIPQSFVTGIGGDRIIGTTFADLLPDLSEDSATAAVVIIGEIGGSYEEDFAQAIVDQKFKKPVIAYISGIFAETLPTGVAFGHAGAIVNALVGTRETKIARLREAGVIIADDPQDIVKKVQSVVQL